MPETAHGTHERMPRVYLSALAVLLLLSQFFGCVQPLDIDMVTIAKDEFAPRIVLIPPDGQVYRSTLAVTGSVEDFVDAEGTKTGSIQNGSLRWGILNKAAAKYNGTFVLDSNNNFTITVDTSDLSEIIVLKVSAVDLSGNTGAAEITLEPYLQGPYIAITSPQDNEEWANELTKTVTGNVQNSPSDSGVEEVDFDTLSVYVTQSENSAAKPDNLVTNAEDGTFSFSFATDGLSTRQPITVSVSDLNGIPYQKTIYIVSSSEGPYIEITSPADRSIYGSFVELTGSVRVSSGADSGTAGITSLAVSLAGDAASSCTYVFNTATEEWTSTVPEGFTLTWDCGVGDGETDGDFFFSFYTAGRENDQYIEIVAENINRRQTVTTLTLRDDNEGPYIDISAPVNYELYSSTVTVTGTVRNNLNDYMLDEIAAILWSVPGSTISGGAVNYDLLDGSFTCSFDVPSTQSGMLTILIAGTDINNNQTAEYIMLIDDREGPIISISSPEQNSLFGDGDNLILVSGTIRNSENEVGSGPSIVEASWAVIGSSVALSGYLDLSAGDDFSINLDTNGITESSISLILSAAGADGHESSFSLTLQNDRKAPVISFS
ncbi:MAG: hypothetical protein JW852_03265, partial [Spirochaetales bacterium]|nr:hypothetical protein [Spirochaetales bacterium]